MLTVSLFLLEAGLWIFAPLTSHEWLTWVPDGHIRGRPAPNQILRTGDGYEVHINSLGFRGPDYAWEPSPGVLRLAAFGGSSTFGLDAWGEDATWPAWLERYLTDALEMPVEVINLALPGYDTQTSKINYLTTGRALHPHVVLIYHTWNDLKRFRALAHQPLLFSAPARNKPWWQKLARKTQLARRMARAVNAARARKMENTYTRVGNVPENPNRPVAPVAFEWAAQNFRDFALFARSDGILPVLITQATIAQPVNVNQREYHLKIRYDLVGMSVPVLCETWVTLNNVIKDVADQTDAVFVDGYSAVRPDSEHLRDHVHLTDRGREVLAQAIGEVLLKDGRFTALVNTIRTTGHKRGATPMLSEVGTHSSPQPSPP